MCILLLHMHVYEERSVSVGYAGLAHQRRRRRT